MNIYDMLMDLHKQIKNYVEQEDLGFTVVSIELSTRTRYAAAGREEDGSLKTEQIADGLPFVIVKASDHRETHIDIEFYVESDGWLRIMRKVTDYSRYIREQ